MTFSKNRILSPRLTTKLLTGHFKVGEWIGIVVVVLRGACGILLIHLIFVPFSRFVCSKSHAADRIFQVEAQSKIKTFSKYDKVDGRVKNKVGETTACVHCQTKLELYAVFEGKWKC